MEIQSALNNLTEIGKELESTFTYMEDCFTKLSKKQNSKFLDKQKEIFVQLEKLNLQQTDNEVEFFSDLNSRYSKFYDSLNESINELNEISSQVSELKNISEEMELIALNAMVISIKSGEKGRAFSKITENLKRLSNMMNTDAQKLIFTEQEFLSNITEIKNLYNQISNAKNTIENFSSSISSTIKDMINSTSLPLENIVSQGQEIYQPILNAKKGLQNKKVIKQTLDKIHQILTQDTQSEVLGIEFNSEMERSLDKISFEISSYELAEKMLYDINAKLLESSQIFKDNWKNVLEIRTQIEDGQKKYISQFLENSTETSDKNWITKLTDEENNSSKTIEQIILLQQTQKIMCTNCKIISKKVLSMHDIFKELEPIIAQLHHVRILQEIEVSKNLAIGTVKNFVDDMDKLITNAQTNLEQLEKNVSQFISDIQILLKNFTETVNKNSDKIEVLKKQKNVFFENLSNYRLDLSNTIQNFTVLPEDFTETCKNTTDKMNGIEKYIKIFNQIIEEYKNFVYTKTSEKEKLLTQYNISSWETKNEKLIDMLNKFSTTTQKETEKIETVQIDDMFEVEDFDFF